MDTRSIKKITNDHYFNQVQKAIFSLYGVNMYDIINGSKKKPLAYYRHFIYYYSYCEQGLTLAETGKLFGSSKSRHHSTIISGRDNISNYIENRDPIAKDYFVFKARMDKLLDKKRTKSLVNSKDVTLRYLKIARIRFANFLSENKGKVINESLVEKIMEQYANRYCNGKSN